MASNLIIELFHDNTFFFSTVGIWGRNALIINFSNNHIITIFINSKNSEWTFIYWLQYIMDSKPHSSLVNELLFKSVNIGLVFENRVVFFFLFVSLFGLVWALETMTERHYTLRCTIFLTLKRFSSIYIVTRSPFRLCSMTQPSIWFLPLQCLSKAEKKLFSSSYFVKYT